MISVPFQLARTNQVGYCHMIYIVVKLHPNQCKNEFQFFYTFLDGIGLYVYHFEVSMLILYHSFCTCKEGFRLIESQAKD